MSRLTLTLPEPLDGFLADQVAEGGYASPEEYLRDLLRRERDRVALRALLLDGAASGPGDVVDDRAFAALRDAIRRGAA
jgi:antitoxin ParD1/3/4